MANVQFCQVCGYALKKMDTQCGRCGESIGEETGRTRDTIHKREQNRFDGGYSIETIGSGAEAAALVERGPQIQQDFGMRQVNHRQIKSTEQDRTMGELQKELRDLNDMIAKMNEEKKTDAAVKSIEGRAAPSAAEYKSDVVRHMRRRSDNDFKKIVSGHVAVLKKATAERALMDSKGNASYYNFVSDSIVKPGIFEGSVILFAGPAGSMKSTMGAFTVDGMARETGGKALYILLDEGEKKFSKRLKEIGLESGKSGHLVIVDRTDIKKKTAEMEGNWRQVMMDYIRQELRKDQFEFVVMDNLNAMYSMVNREIERKAVFEFFDWVRELGLTSIVIKEGEYGRVVRDKSAEAYLADGVVQFHRRKRGDGSLIPMFRVVKMRGAEIDSRYYALQVSSGNLRFVPAVAT